MTERRVVSSVFRPGLFRGKTAIVTGGGTGIGKTITQELLHLGCNVMIASRNVERLQETLKELRDGLPDCCKERVDLIECNIRKEEQVKNLIRKTLEKWGKLDYLVNNGGGQFFAPASEFSLKGWNAVIETNLTGTFLCCREAYNQWMKDHGGIIVNMIANMWGGWPGMSHSGAARAGVDNITKSLAIEWAPSGVRINAVAPGSTIYSPTAVAHYADRTQHRLHVGMLERVKTIPAKRLGTTDEVSAVICFLLSPAAAFISGETIRIDAGQSLVTTSIPWPIPDHDRLPAYTWETDNQGKDNQCKSKL